MKLFKFPLESLQTLRQQKERMAQQQYARALNARDAAEAPVHEAERKLAAAWEELVVEMSEGAAAAEIQAQRTWCAALETQRKELQAVLDEARRVVSVALQEMLAATRDREALERFCQKARRAHLRAAQREEQKSFDELAVQMSGGNGLLQLASPAS